MHRSTLKGSAHTPFLVFLGIVGLSVLFFFIFSAGSLKKKPKPVSAAPPPTVPEVRTPPVVPPVPPPATPPPTFTPAGAPQVAALASLDDLLANLATHLRAGDFAAVRKFTVNSPGAEERVAFLKQVLTGCGWRAAAANPWADAGVITGINRRQLKLEPAKDGAAVPAGAVMADFERVAGEGWRVKAWRFDAALTAQVATLTGGSPAASALVDAPDPLDVARNFLSTALGHDFKSARSFTDPAGVSREKLAGMCIVFEDAGYRVKESAPVRITAMTEKSAWAFVRLISDKPGLGEGEVGLQMQRTPEGAWLIRAVDFNSLLENYVQASGAGKVFYSPIVKSASGGESIVLYFEFDKAGLHPRALHQLDIIAGLLKTDPGRKIHITGHSDAVGSDDYNVRLSATRAKNVSARLLELGVTAAQIETKGFGSAAPLDADKLADGSDNPEGRSRNRRTEIYLDF